MILLTPCWVSSSAAFWTETMGVVKVTFLPGLEMKGVSVVVAPMKPIFCPPTSLTTYGLRARAARSGSLEKSTLDVISGKRVWPSQVFMRKDTPLSNSWLPMVAAVGLIRFQNSRSATPSYLVKYREPWTKSPACRSTALVSFSRSLLMMSVAWG